MAPPPTAFLALVLVGCAANAEAPATTTEVPTCPTLTVAEDATAVERRAVFEAAVWWAACGYEIGTVGAAVEVRFVDDAPIECEIEGTLGCFATATRIVIVSRGVSIELLPVVIAHEFGHALGFPHEGDGLMSERTQVKKLAEAECP